MSRARLASRLTYILAEAVSCGVSKAIWPVVEKALEHLANGHLALAEDYVERAAEALTVAKKLKVLDIDPAEFVGPEGVDWAKLSYCDDTELLTLLSFP